jgi:hypothetical protein
MVRCPDVFDQGNGILDRFVDVNYSWLNRNICTYNHWDNHSYVLGSRRRGLLPIPQYTDNYTTVLFVTTNIVMTTSGTKKKNAPNEVCPSEQDNTQNEGVGVTG